MRTLLFIFSPSRLSSSQSSLPLSLFPPPFSPPSLPLLYPRPRPLPSFPPLRRLVRVRRLRRLCLDWRARRSECAIYCICTTLHTTYTYSIYIHICSSHYTCVCMYIRTVCMRRKLILHSIYILFHHVRMMCMHVISACFHICHIVFLNLKNYRIFHAII